MRSKQKPQGAAWGGERGRSSERLQPHSTTFYTSNSIPVYRSDGRICGEIAGDILRKTARREHQLQRPAAWGWDTAIIDQAEQAGARFTEITDDNGRIWRASLADFRRHGVRVNRGYGEQVALPLSFWQVRKVGETAVFQPSLFGGAT